MIDQEVNACLSCLNPLCEKACPVKNHIRDFIKALKEDDLLKARAILAKANPFPYITCRLCAYSKQCEGHCVKHFKGEAVKIHEIEKYIADSMPDARKKKASNKHSVALVGAGIANLALAKELLLDGYEVVLFEKEAFAGGTIKTGIPDFRFDKKYLDMAIKEVTDLGAVFHYETMVDAAKLKELSHDFDRVVIGTGAMQERKMGIVGEEYAYSGLKVLYDLNILKQRAKYQMLKHVLVIGGGNVAMDVANSLKAFVQDVTLVYRRSFKEMPANIEEIEEAKNRGVHFLNLTNLKALHPSDQGLVASLIKMELTIPGSDGRTQVKEIAGSEYSIACDAAVMAIGQKFASLSADFTYENHHTSYPFVYIVGDANLGPSTVAGAIGDAMEVKSIIDESF